MKRILLTALALFVMSSAFAYDPSVSQNQGSYAKIVTCSTSTASTLFTEDALGTVQYDNQSSFSIVIATYVVTIATAASGCYTIPAGRTSSSLLTLATPRFKYAITAGTTTAQNLSVLIIK